MALLRRKSGNGNGKAMATLLLGLFLSMNTLPSASAASGGTAGGSFFPSGSGSSSTSRGVIVIPGHGPHEYAPSPEAPLTWEESSHGPGVLLILGFLFCLLIGFCIKFPDTTVLKLQIAMLRGKGNSIQRNLTRIAETADTSSPQGVSNLLKETILALLQQPDYCISGYSSVDQKWIRKEGEACFNQLSNEERAKFDEETLVNLNKKISTRSRSVKIVLDVKDSTEEGDKFLEEELLDGFGNEYIVITILVAATGAHSLPTINGAEDLKEALQKLRSISSHQLLAGELLWTPQIEDEILSHKELLINYPELAKARSRDKTNG